MVKKLLWVGQDPRSRNRDGRFAHNFCTSALEFYDVHVFATAYLGDLGESKFNIVNGNDNTNFGISKLSVCVDSLNPGIIVLFGDVNVVAGWCNILSALDLKNTLIIGYVNNSHTNIHEQEIMILNQITDSLIVNAQFVKDDLLSNGCTRDISVVGGGYSRDDLPLRNKDECRKEFQLGDVDFIVYSGARNHPRNRLDILIRAFAEFTSRHPNESIKLLMNCGLRDTGWNVRGLFKRMCEEKNVNDWEKRLILANQMVGPSQNNDEFLSKVYAATDLGVNTGTGDDCNLTSIEHASTGVAQIVPGWMGAKEVFNKGGSLIEPYDYYVYPYALQQCSGEAHVMNYMDVANEMDNYYLDRELLEDRGSAAATEVETMTWSLLGREFIKVLLNCTKNTDGFFFNRDSKEAETQTS